MLLTIITVVKNDKNNILKTIRSVKKQKYKNYEYIIVDGKSIDGTSEIIKAESIKSKKIKHIIKKDKNLYQALNYGIKISKGNVISILHSGDIFFNDSITNYYMANMSKYDAISGNIIFIKKNKIRRLWNYKIKKLNINNSFKIAHTSLVIKKNFFNLIGNYNTKYSISSDTDFILRMSRKQNIKFKYFNKIFVVMNTGGLSSNSLNYINKCKQDLLIYKDHFNKSFLFKYLYKISYKFLKLIVWKVFN